MNFGKTLEKHLTFSYHGNVVVKFEHKRTLSWSVAAILTFGSIFKKPLAHLHLVREGDLNFLKYFAH